MRRRGVLRMRIWRLRGRPVRKRRRVLRRVLRFGVSHEMRETAIKTRRRAKRRRRMVVSDVRLSRGRDLLFEFRPRSKIGNRDVHAFGRV